MKYVRFQRTNRTIGIGTLMGRDEQGREVVLVGGHEFRDGICTVTDQENPLAPTNARIVLTHHRAKLIESSL